MWTPRFNVAIDFTLKWETEYEKGHDGDDNFVITEHNPKDPGGATRYGIDQRDHPLIDVSRLTLDQARQIYFQDEWGHSHAEQLPEGVGEACFDAAVNCGLREATHWLQQTLIGQGTYLGTLDGLIGPQTLQAAFQRPQATLPKILDLRRAYYNELAKQDRFKEDLDGWLNRVNDLQEFAEWLMDAARK